jgi:NPCBM/NEW2 domain
MINRFIWISILLMLGAIRASAADVSTLTGKKFSGDILSVRDGVLTMRTSGGPIGIATKELYLVQFGNPVVTLKPETRIDEIELLDGSLLRFTAFTIREKLLTPVGLEVPSVPAAKIAVPLETIFHYCRNAGDAKVKAEWKKLLANRGKRDWLVVRQGDTLSPLPGTILGGVPTGDAIEFEREDNNQKQTFKTTRISGGLVFNQPARSVIPPTLCKLTDRFGNVLLVQSLDITKNAIQVKTVAGMSIEYPTFAAFSTWDFSQGNITYLSDLKPKVSAPTPVPGEPTLAFVKDRSPDGELLRLQGVSYAKGLWLYPDVTLSYSLNQDFRELKLLAGLDDTVPVANATVKLVIKNDGKTIFAESFARKDPPRTLNFDMKGVKELQVTLEGSGLFLGQQLNLIEAKLQK